MKQISPEGHFPNMCSVFRETDKEVNHPGDVIVGDSSLAEHFGRRALVEANAAWKV